MVYFPTFTIKIDHIWENIPYMDPMGVEVAVFLVGFFDCKGYVAASASRTHAVLLREDGHAVSWGYGLAGHGYTWLHYR